MGLSPDMIYKPETGGLAGMAGNLVQPSPGISYDQVLGRGNDILANITGKRYKSSADLSKDQNDFEQYLQQFNAQNQNSDQARNAIGYAENTFRPGVRDAGSQMMSQEDVARQDAQAKQIRAEQDAKIKAEQDAATQREQEVRSRFDQIYPQLESGLASKINAQFVPARQKLISEEKALGRLDSPASIVPLSNLDASRENAMAQGLGGLAAQRASGETDLAKTLETVLAGDRRAGEDVTQFNQGLGLARQGLAEKARQFGDTLDYTRQNDLQNRIMQGKQLESAGSDHSSLLDKIQKGVDITKGVVDIGSSFMPKPKK